MAFSASLVLTESQHTLSPPLQSNLLDDLEGFYAPNDNVEKEQDWDEEDVEALDVRGQKFYAASVVAKVQKRHERLSIDEKQGGGRGEGEDWGDDFEENGDETDAECAENELNLPLLRLKISEDMAMRQDKVRQDAENMRTFAHHVEDLRILHERTKTFATTTLDSINSTAVTRLHDKFSHDLARVRVLLDFASEKDGSSEVTNGDTDILIQLLGLETQIVASESNPLRLSVGKPEVAAIENEEEEDWDAEFEDEDNTPSTAFARYDDDDSIDVLETGISHMRLAGSAETMTSPLPPKLGYSQTTPSSATLGGPIAESKHRIRFEVSMIPTLSKRIEEMKKRLAEYARGMESITGTTL